LNDLFVLTVGVFFFKFTSLDKREHDGKSARSRRSIDKVAGVICFWGDSRGSDLIFFFLFPVFLERKISFFHRREHPPFFGFLPPAGAEDDPCELPPPPDGPLGPEAGLITDRMASSKTRLRPSCVYAEHSR